MLKIKAIQPVQNSKRVNLFLTLIILGFVFYSVKDNTKSASKDVPKEQPQQEEIKKPTTLAQNLTTNDDPEPTEIRPEMPKATKNNTVYESKNKIVKVLDDVELDEVPEDDGVITKNFTVKIDKRKIAPYVIKNMSKILSTFGRVMQISKVMSLKDFVLTHPVSESLSNFYVGCDSIAKIKFSGTGYDGEPIFEEQTFKLKPSSRLNTVPEGLYNAVSGAQSGSKMESIVPQNFAYPRVQKSIKSLNPEQNKKENMVYFTEVLDIQNPVDLSGISHYAKFRNIQKNIKCGDSVTVDIIVRDIEKEIITTSMKKQILIGSGENPKLETILTMYSTGDKVDIVARGEKLGFENDIIFLNIEISPDTNSK